MFLGSADAGEGNKAFFFFSEMDYQCHHMISFHTQRHANTLQRILKDIYFQNSSACINLHRLFRLASVAVCRLDREDSPVKAERQCPV